MKIDVIIPFHGRIDMLLRCLNALSLTSVKEDLVIYLINDGSPEKNLSILLNKFHLFSSLSLVNLDQKIGFLKAVNYAWPLCIHEITVVMNNDIIPGKHLFENLRKVLKMDNRIAVVAPTSNNPKDLFQYRKSQNNYHSERQGLYYLFTDYLTAMCIAIRRSAISENWLFDPAYSPGYFEDLDLSCRLKQSGWLLAILESEYIHHEGAATFGSDPNLCSILRYNYKQFSSRWAYLPGHYELDSLLSI